MCASFRSVPETLRSLCLMCVCVCVRVCVRARVRDLYRYCHRYVVFGHPNPYNTWCWISKCDSAWFQIMFLEAVTIVAVVAGYVACGRVCDSSS